MAVEFTVQQHFANAPDRVFQALTDLDGAANWMPGLIKIEVLSEGAIGKGTEWRETRKIFGKEVTEQFEVTRFEPPTGLALRVDGSKGTSKRGEYRFEYQLTPRKGGTELTLHGAVRGLGGIVGLISKLFGTFEKACAKDLQALATHLASPVEAPPPPGS